MPPKETKEGRPGRRRPDSGAPMPAERTQHGRSDEWTQAMEQWVCSENIERFREQLAMETNRHNRGILMRLLREQESSLRRLTVSGGPDGETGHAPIGGADSDTDA